MNFALSLIYICFICLSSNVFAKADNAYILDKSDTVIDSNISNSIVLNDIINKEINKENEVITKNEENENISKILDKVLQSVAQVKAFKVNDESIIGNKNNYFDYKESMNLNSIGSAFIISDDGYLLTNNHVVDGADSIIIYLNNIEYKAELIGSDFYKDIALLKINSKQKLVPMKLIEDIKYNVGDKVLAIGNPYGLGISISSGIISALDRNIKDIELNNLIQIDALINKGNSGGPLIDYNGNIIGINTILYSNSKNNNGSSLGFAIPINSTLETINKLKEFGYIQYGWLGISGNDINNDIFEILNSKRRTGVFVTNVNKNSPADKAGILVGDIIISYSGKHISTFNQLLSFIRATAVDSSVDVLVLRNGKYIKLKATIEDSPENNKYNVVNEKIKKNSVEFMDMIITKIDDNFVDKYEIYNHKNGMYVVDVKKNGLADYYNIEVGDIILTINQFQLKTKNDYDSAISNLKLNKNKNFFMIIKKKKDKKNIVLKLNFNLINN